MGRAIGCRRPVGGIGRWGIGRGIVGSAGDSTAVAAAGLRSSRSSDRAGSHLARVGRSLAADLRTGVLVGTAVRTVAVEGTALAGRIVAGEDIGLVAGTVDRIEVEEGIGRIAVVGRRGSLDQSFLRFEV